MKGMLRIEPTEHAQLLSKVNPSEKVITVVNFWATWCKPCVEEIPEFVQFQKWIVENSNAEISCPVRLIFVSFDFKNEIEKKVFPFLESRNFSGTHYFVDEKQTTFIDGIDPQWQGQLPTTFIYFQGKQKTRIDKTITFGELLTSVKLVCGSD
ncbi:MAG: hypothetical protein A3H98_02425 [Bacteroidetes bacterium RIFCSPLOWO2_02_FULL_36_8]|nr:MAG: hypothetical protein A3H98_02425 [Bacteroidetes bacterium RIFCSPLOWO2_02_FULL_36_8]OFY70974.1 MAG: hypothetical protein A3G23_12730 [Bacteroidetes bacterium RIFCSPLOWO2_12_FULL_37_12]